MNDLASWLLEQIDEDEKTAREIEDYDFNARESRACRVEWINPSERWGDTWRLAVPAERLLAECEAKRRIIERLPAVIKHHAPFEREWEWCPKARTEPWGDLPWGPDAECECGADEENAHGGNWFLRVLALPYADRPGYLEEWRP